MLVDDELLTREDDRWVASSDLSAFRCPRRFTRCWPLGSRACPADERAIVTAASVEGTVFHRGAVSELTPDALDADSRAQL